MGEDPFLPLPAPVERMAILQGHHAAGGLADVGDRAVGLEIEGRHFRRDRREGRRAILPVDAHAAAIGIKAGQAPAIGVIAGGAPPTGQPVEGETHVGGGVGAEGQQFTHRTGFQRVAANS